MPLPQHGAHPSLPPLHRGGPSASNIAVTRKSRTRHGNTEAKKKVTHEPNASGGCGGYGSDTVKQTMCLSISDMAPSPAPMCKAHQNQNHRPRRKMWWLWYRRYVDDVSLSIAHHEHAPNWVAEHLGASSRRPRNPFPAQMAGVTPGRVPVYTALAHPVTP